MSPEPPSVGAAPSRPGAAPRVTAWCHLIVSTHGMADAERAPYIAETKAVAEAMAAEKPALEVACWHLTSAVMRVWHRLGTRGPATSLPTGFWLLVALCGQARLALHDPSGRVSGSPVIAALFCAALAMVAVLLVASPSIRSRRSYGLCALAFSATSLTQALFYRDPGVLINATRKFGLVALAVGLAGICLWSFRGEERLFSGAIITVSLAGFVVAASAGLSALTYRQDSVTAISSALVAVGAMTSAATAPRLRRVPASSA